MSFTAREEMTGIAEPEVLSGSNNGFTPFFRFLTAK